jgi:hypothetical protein
VSRARINLFGKSISGRKKVRVATNLAAVQQGFIN